MEIFYNKEAVINYINLIRNSGKSIGFVPTMGSIHEGHLALLKASQRKDDITIFSIYVNPAQFNNPGDLEKYPRDESRDLELLRKENCSAVFIPGNDEMYTQKKYISLDYGTITQSMEGEYRPGHFNGVGIVLIKFFNMLKPDRAYFGLKDLQQYLVVKRIVIELFFRLEVVGVPTAREENGLAHSSRNFLLTDQQKSKASIFYQTLKEAKENLLRGMSVKECKNLVSKTFEKRNLDTELEYFEIVDSDSMEKLNNIDESKNISLCIAGFVGQVRLIDNIYLN